MYRFYRNFIAATGSAPCKSTLFKTVTRSLPSVHRVFSSQRLVLLPPFHPRGTYTVYEDSTEKFPLGCEKVETGMGCAALHDLCPVTRVRVGTECTSSQRVPPVTMASIKSAVL